MKNKRKHDIINNSYDQITYYFFFLTEKQIQMKLINVKNNWKNGNMHENLI